MEIQVNGQRYDVGNEPNKLLLWVLRDELGLIGTKFGCGAGICGACTVHLNGVPTRTCVTTLGMVEEAEIRTIEVLATVDAAGNEQLHPVQQAFIEQQVPQCGWCMSGQMMQAAAFLAETPAPTEAEINEAMRRNYCRCGCYMRIKQAIQVAASQMEAR